MDPLDDVGRANAGFNRALAGGDAAEIASWYTETARLLPDGAPRVDGRAAIRHFFQQGIDAGFGGLELETLEVTDSADLAIEIGRWTSTTGETETGKYVVIWRRGPDGLRIDLDIFNADRRAGG